jgi:hypothetical protein
MASNFPSSLDTFTNPSSSDAMDSVSVPHATQHSDLNDAVEALQAKVGADSSGVVSSHDYKIAALEAISHGKILQVVSTTKTDNFTTTSTSFVDVTGMSVSITPTSSTSKVLITCNAITGISLNNQIAAFQFVRDSTPIGLSTHATNNTTFMDGDGSVGIRPGGSSFLDSPATTSATTYKLQMRATAGTGFLGYANNNYGAIATLTVMEVSA